MKIMKSKETIIETSALAVEVYKEAIQIRYVEETLLQLFSLGKLNGTVHTCIGQELSAIAFAGQLKKGDTVFSNHRCHGHYLSFTKDYEGLIAELMGKADGTCGGVGGSQHLCKDDFFSNGVQGGIVPVTAGIALAKKLRRSDNIAVVFIGDGTLGQGAVYESMNIISKWGLPVLIVCENNFYAQSTPQSVNLAGDITARAQAFGLKAFHNNIWDEKELLSAARESIDYVRKYKGPVFHLVDMYRLGPHSKGDDDRDVKEIKAYEQKDPVHKFAKSNPEIYKSILEETKQKIDSLVQEISLQGELPLAQYYQKKEHAPHIQWEPLESVESRQVELINHFFKDNMARDEKIVFMGEDILSPYGGAFKVARDLSHLYPQRVFSTPISEAAILGVANGLALSGFRPFVEIMFGDFVTLCMDQLLNHASKFHHMYNKQINCPIVIRTPMGGRRGYGPTHSQTLDRLVSGIPNTTTIALNTLVNPQIIYESILQNEKHPVVVVENKMDYGRMIADKKYPFYVYEKSKEDYPVVRISPKSQKADATIVCWGGMVHSVLECLQPLFEESEILVEVIVLSKISPLDCGAILESARKTKRMIVVEEGTLYGGIASEILASVHEQLDENITSKRLAALPVPIPSAKSLEKQVLIQPEDIIKAVEDACS